MHSVKLVPLVFAPASSAPSPLPGLVLTHAASAEEACPITMLPIADSEPLHLFGKAPLRCAELRPCGHRFAAMPLLTYFALHEMRCPLCRAGRQGARMSPLGTFPDQPWAEELHRRALAAQQQADAENDQEEAQADEEDDDDGWAQSHRRSFAETIMAPMRVVPAPR